MPVRRVLSRAQRAGQALRHAAAAPQPAPCAARPSQLPAWALCAPAGSRLAGGARCLGSSAAAAALAPAPRPAPGPSIGAAAAWLSFLEHLHAGGYFAAPSGAQEASDGADGGAAAAAPGLVPRFGSAGDHKRAVLAHAREREGALRSLPASALRALAAAELPQAVLDAPFGGRKTVNAVKRLRAALQVATPKGCACARHGHPAQGDAALPDAVRLLLCWATTALPPHVVPPAVAMEALLAALTVTPAGAGGAAQGGPLLLPAQKADDAVRALTDAAMRSSASERAFERKRFERRALSSSSTAVPYWEQRPQSPRPRGSPADAPRGARQPLRRLADGAPPRRRVEEIEDEARELPRLPAAREPSPRRTEEGFTESFLDGPAEGDEPPLSAGATTPPSAAPRRLFDSASIKRRRGASAAPPPPPPPPPPPRISQQEVEAAATSAVLRRTPRVPRAPLPRDGAAAAPALRRLGGGGGGGARAEPDAWSPSGVDASLWDGLPK